MDLTYPDQAEEFHRLGIVKGSQYPDGRSALSEQALQLVLTHGSSSARLAMCHYSTVSVVRLVSS